MAKRPRRLGLSCQPRPYQATETTASSSVKQAPSFCLALSHRITMRLKGNNTCKKPAESIRGDL